MALIISTVCLPEVIPCQFQIFQNARGPLLDERMSLIEKTVGASIENLLIEGRQSAGIDTPANQPLDQAFLGIPELFAQRRRIIGWSHDMRTFPPEPPASEGFGVDLLPIIIEWQK